MKARKTYIIELKKGKDLTSSLFRIPKGSVVQLRVGSSLFGHQVALFSEAPSPGSQFVRGSYREVGWDNQGRDGAEQFAIIPLDTPGSFHYYFRLDGKNNIDGCGYMLVEPLLKIADEVLELDGIQCITVLSKCLGPLSTWTDKLMLAKQSGYNMIHFTPIQELGGSKSGYSLQDQLKVNPNFGENGEIPTMQDINKITDLMRKQWKVLSLCDIVVNHTANESKLLREHPECAYNLVNSPHLRPAYLLDIVLHKLSLSAAAGELEVFGIPQAVNSEQHLDAIRHILIRKLESEMKISELFMVDVRKLVEDFQSESSKGAEDKRRLDGNIKIIQDPLYRRLKSTIDMKLALALYNNYRSDCFDEDSRRKKCAEMFKAKLDELNAAVKAEVGHHLMAAIENSISTIRYFRLQADGPKIPLVTLKDPLVPRYFVEYGEAKEEDAFLEDRAKYVMAHNGWVMNHDPLCNFAEPGSNVYLRRELIAWGDSVKLRYGEKEEDCPFLWKHMKKYVETTAKVFDGVRLDNCHSTPLPVAQYLLDAARKINPNLYVVAELFTNSDSTDNIFVNKLGITSLIREALSAWDSHEEGRLVYRYGGRAVGGFKEWVEDGRRLVGDIAHALFLDMTHDNPSPVEKRSVFDMLPSSALVSMAASASGSTAGYDQLVPHHIHVVNEERYYMGLSKSPLENGIALGKLALNKLHSWLSKNKFDQVFVDQIDKDIVCVTRHNKRTLESIVLFAYTSFCWPDDNACAEGRGVNVSSRVTSIIFEAYLHHKSGERFARPTEYKKDDEVINGLSEYVLDIREDLEPTASNMVCLSDSQDGGVRISLTRHFKPGSVVVLRLRSGERSEKAVEDIIRGVPDAMKAASCLNLADLNVALYRCAQEEHGNVYTVPGFGPLVYCGLQGIMSVLDKIAVTDDLGHPLCSNLRDGLWLAEYTADRLKKVTGTAKLGETLGKVLSHLGQVPPPMRPAYFHCIISQVHATLLHRVSAIMSQFINDGSEFVKMLACGSVQCGGVVESATLPPLSANISPPLPPQHPLTLAAGLPHFSTGYMRSWGRDTFIALRGLFLLTGRFDEARYHILGYGGCLRHGLIPNLLDSGKPRYNCRDAVWWWLYTIKCYTDLVPHGLTILQDKVNRLFPTDLSPPTSVEAKLCDVIEEALNVHFQVLCFRERNAGKQIDEHMTSYGFDNQIGVDPITGFVFGGNEWNCGTWMDKMGSSEAAGTKGKPATPRDGSAIEIVALAKSAVTWLDKLHSNNKYPHPGVSRINKDGLKIFWSWKDWSDKIQANFEKEFWVDDGNDEKHVNRRGIYKDSVGASQQWADFQLRPNFTIAMVVAPELFTPSRAARALKAAEEHLLGPLGIKTLDPSDWAYRGHYDNSDQSSDANLAHGFNYHQGPEWVWPVGYYLRGVLLFGGKDKVSRVRRVMARHWAALHSSPWRGLPELTNAGGEYCSGSCPTQAWSNASLIEVLYDLRKLEEAET